MGHALWTSVLLIPLAILLASQQNNKTVSKLLQSLAIAFGLFMLSIGISQISTAGAINALLVFESGRAAMEQSAFDALHKTLDPYSNLGYLHAIVGSLLVTYGMVSLHKNS